MKIVICDDLEKDRIELRSVLLQFEKEKNIEFTIVEYDNPEKLLMDYDTREEPKIVFLDVYMDNVLGTDVAKAMRNKGYQGSIVFCTTSKEHALDGFRVHADGYIVKPYTYNEFKEALVKLDYLFESEQKRITFTSDRIEYEMPYCDIYLIETDSKGCMVHTSNGIMFTWKKMKDFMSEINADCFYQMSRYYLVNMDCIQNLKEESIVLKNGFEVFLPKRDLKKVKQKINDYIWKSMRS